MKDKEFINVEWDKNKPWEGIITLENGRTAKVDFDIGEKEEQAAKNTLKSLIANETQIRHQIAVSLFKHYEDWIPEYITAPEQLAQRIELSDISLWEDGGQLHYYANGDDEIFTSHAICVWLNANGEIEDEVELDG